MENLFIEKNFVWPKVPEIKDLMKKMETNLSFI